MSNHHDSGRTRSSNIPVPTPREKAPFLSVKGLLFYFLLFYSSIVGSCFLMAPMLLLMPFARNAYRMWTSFIATMWFTWACFLLEKLLSIKILLSGDQIPLNERFLLISNHRTRIDWMFIWTLALRLGCLDAMKIIVKDSLKAIPGFGWAMQMFLFIFLKRNWSADQQNISRFLNYFLSYGEPVALLLFPEGTDLSESNIQRSNEFARANKKPMLQYVLHPRVTGWLHTFNLMRSNIDAVYDLTLGYVDYVKNERPSELSLLNGRVPRGVHIFIKRYPVSQMPLTDDGLRDWLDDRFVEKERRLRTFYTTAPMFGESATKVYGKLPVEEYLPAVFFWVFYGLLVAGTLVTYWWARWYFVAVCIILASLTHYGGIDELELRLHSYT